MAALIPNSSRRGSSEFQKRASSATARLAGLDAPTQDTGDYCRVGRLRCWWIRASFGGMLI